METAERPPLMRWTTERFMALVASGVIPERRGIELLDGQVVAEMPQGDAHFDALKAIQRALAAAGGFNHGMMVGPTIILPDDNVYDPEIAFLSPTIDHLGGVPREGVLFVIEVSDSSRAYDLGTKKQAYARAGIPHYWVVDVAKQGIWNFSSPESGRYADECFVAAGEPIRVPLIGATLDTGAIFLVRP